MKTGLGVVAMALALAACAPSKTAERVAGDPYQHCRERGQTADAEALERCLDAVIAERCPTAGERAEPCAERLREAAFLSRQLELRGYDLFNQST